MDKLYTEAVDLLSELIRTPSFSQEEAETAEIISTFLSHRGVPWERHGNNVIARTKGFDDKRPTILLNSHHDTVKPNQGYTKDPFQAILEDGKLYGLGSNDAGGCLVSLISCFLYFYDKNLPYNLVLAATAEEENSGEGGVESVLNQIGSIEFGMIGEPTEMNMGVTEKGLMVLDCYSKGRAGHAARDQGINAIYEALPAIDWFRNFQFDEESSFLGPIKMSVTMIESGYQHNVVPDICHFVVDVRTTDAYTNEETLAIIKSNVDCEVKARSTRLNSSRLPEDSSISQVAERLGIAKFGSPTTSDQAVIPYPTFKMGPGRSQRSHTPDEFIYVDEIKAGITGYIHLLESLFKYVQS